MSIITHTIALMVGGTIGMLAFAIARAAGDAEWYERGGAHRADLREVVTCDRCRHSSIQRHTGDDTLACMRHKTHGEKVEPDHFCGYGEV